MRKKINPWHVVLLMAQNHSLSKAAEILEADRSTASRALKQLEETLGFNLIERNSKPARLSDNARSLLPSLRALNHAQSQFDLTLKSILSDSEPKKRLIRISLPINMGRAPTLQALDQYAKAHPDIEFEISTDATEEDVLEGRVDIAWFGFEPLRKESFYVHCPGLNWSFLMATPKYFKQHGRPQSIEELQAHQLLIRDSNNGSYSRRLENNEAVYELPESANLLQADALTCKNRLIASEGIAIDLTTGFLARELAAGEVIPVLPQWHRAPWPIHLVCLKANAESECIKEIMRLIGTIFNRPSMEHWRFWFTHFNLPMPKEVQA